MMSRSVKAMFLGAFMLGMSSMVVLGDLVEEKTMERVASNLSPYIGVAVVFVIVAVVIIISLRKRNK